MFAGLNKNNPMLILAFSCLMTCSTKILSLLGIEAWSLFRPTQTYPYFLSHHPVLISSIGAISTWWRRFHFLSCAFEYNRSFSPTFILCSLSLNNATQYIKRSMWNHCVELASNPVQIFLAHPILVLLPFIEQALTMCITSFLIPHFWSGLLLYPWAYFTVVGWFTSTTFVTS